MWPLMHSHGRYSSIQIMESPGTIQQHCKKFLFTLVPVVQENLQLDLPYVIRIFIFVNVSLEHLFILILCLCISLVSVSGIAKCCWFLQCHTYDSLSYIKQFVTIESYFSFCGLILRCCSNMVKKRSKEAFVAFREALKYK